MSFIKNHLSLFIDVWKFIIESFVSSVLVREQNMEVLIELTIEQRELHLFNLFGHNGFLFSLQSKLELYL